MKTLLLLAALVAAPALVSAQDTMTIQRSSCTTNEAGEMICSEPVAITVPARPASTPDRPEKDTQPIGLVCHQNIKDAATIKCGHQYGNHWGPIVINLCRWSEDGTRACKTTVSEPHNPL